MGGTGALPMHIQKVIKRMKEREEARTIRIKICTFGKTLDIKDIIESVSYEKGNKNDIGDEPDDYVVIKLRDEAKTRVC